MENATVETPSDIKEEVKKIFALKEKKDSSSDRTVRSSHSRKGSKIISTNENPPSKNQLLNCQKELLKSKSHTVPEVTLLNEQIHPILSYQVKQR